MQDERLVPSLIYGLESRFLFITLCWCISIEREALGLGPLPKGKKHPKEVQAYAAYASRRIMSEFFFSWLVTIEACAREVDGGVVRKERFDEAMLWGGGQCLYNLFASRCVRGPYALPWDNAFKFRQRVLIPVAGMMREDERLASAVIPPEAKQLLELRGLTFNF